MQPVSQPILLKVYGHLLPADEALLRRLEGLCGRCCPLPEQTPCVLTGNLLNISYEGIYFPVQEVVQVVAGQLRIGQMGKLDELDLEEWRLTRYIFADGEVRESSAPLNNVLDYSGH